MNDETIDVAGLETGIEGFSRVEADEFNFPRQPGIAESEQHARGGGFVAGINAGDFAAVATDQIFRDLFGGVSRDAGVLIGGEETHSGKIFFHDFEEAFLAFLGAGGADGEAEHDDVALAADEAAEIACGDAAAFTIVGRDVARDRFAREAGIDDDDGDFAAARGFHGRNERFIVERREHDAIDAAADEVFDDLDLLLAVIFLQRTFPDDVYGDALSGEFDLSLFGARVDGFPEFMGRAFGNDGDLIGIGRRGQNSGSEEGETSEQGFFHGGE